MARRHVVELKTCGRDDPDGLRTAIVVVAHLRAEHLKAAHRLLWRQLAMVACIWSVVALTTSMLTSAATLVGFAAVGGVACWAVFREWRAEIRVGALMGDARSEHRGKISPS